MPEGMGRLDRRRWGVFLAARARQGGRRVRGSLVPILQAALAAAAAWLVAEHLFGRQNPMFAPIAAWVCLGFKTDRVLRKVAELGVGATVGVLIGEVFAIWLDAGWWQILLALVCAALVGRFLDRGDLTTIQAGVNAIVIVAMMSWQAAAGGVTGRWIDALVGAGVAFVVAALLPRHPLDRPRRYARSTLTEFAALLGMLGRGLQAGDVELLTDARGQRRAVAELTSDWSGTLTSAREVITFNPSLWRQRAEVDELDRIFRLLDRAQRSTAMITRQGRSMTQETGAMPAVGAMLIEVSDAAVSLAGSVGHWQRPTYARAQLLDIASRAAPDELAEGAWRPAVLVSLTRAVVVDLLQVCGLSREQARQSLAGAEDRLAIEGEGGRADSDDEPSALWG